jgi:nicotinate-nucleotide adenylyltransferase
MRKKNLTIALFGGSFDPPHIGHKDIVQELKKLDFIDKIIIMPTFLNPFKSESHASSELRFSWLKKIFNNFKNVEISSFEVEKNRQVPTIESVEFLLKTYKKIYLVIGADHLNSLDKWDSYEKLKERVTFIIVTRDNIALNKAFMTLHVEQNISSASRREKMQISKVPQICAKEIEKFYKDKNEQ